MNLILLFEEDFIDGTNRVKLGGRRLSHILNVHRAQAGDELTVGLAGGLIGRGMVTSISKDHIEMELSLAKRPPDPLPVTLVLALPRPKVLRRTLLTACSMGVKKIALINAFRVEKSFWSSPVLSPGSIKDHLISGLEQARDTVLPEVSLWPLFRPFVEDELPGIMGNTTALLAHPGAELQCPRSDGRHVTLVVGPEGGFIPYEIEKLTACGFQTVSLGERVLKVEAAVPALLARLS